MAGELFDRAVRTLPTGKTVSMTKQDFDAMPLSERVSAILGKQIKFYRGTEEIPAKQALSQR